MQGPIAEPMQRVTDASADAEWYTLGFEIWRRTNYFTKCMNMTTTRTLRLFLRRAYPRPLSFISLGTPVTINTLGRPAEPLGVPASLNLIDWATWVREARDPLAK